MIPAQGHSSFVFKLSTMTHTYNITGMTCGGCVAKAKSALLKLGDVTAAEVQLAEPQATITMQKHIPVSDLQKALSAAGTYAISENGSHTKEAIEEQVETKSWLTTYKPLLIIAAYIIGITMLVEFKTGFNIESWMQNFMAAFFFVFCFFKVLDLKGFAESYAMYDIIARRWKPWGYVYAYIELGLAISYLMGFAPLITNTVTLLVMTISITGVLQSVLNKKKIQCACLGAVFNLPMSSVTIIEDALMIVMSGAMLLSHQILH